MARGGGIESQTVYTSISYDFLNIPNIHVMRESMRKLVDLCYPKPENNNWHKALEETKWLNYIRQILLGSLMVAEKINSQRSVLVHCSDGWDRTAQITSLPQLMLDPYFRTIRGFETLVDKEWLLMGHKISQRTGGLTEESGSTSSTSQKSERAPIFLQFVDCVWQMTQQFLAAFEFNEQFLVDLLDAVYSGLYGNFLFNSEQQRRANDVYTRTLSFWDHVNSDLERYRNPLYTPSDESGHRVLFPQYRLPCIRFWNNYYLRHYLPCRRQDPIADYSRILSHRKRIFQTQLNRQPESDEEIAGVQVLGDARKI